MIQNTTLSTDESAVYSLFKVSNFKRNDIYDLDAGLMHGMVNYTTKSKRTQMYIMSILLWEIKPVNCAHDKQNLELCEIEARFADKYREIGTPDPLRYPHIFSSISNLPAEYNLYRPLLPWGFSVKKKI